MSHKATTWAWSMRDISSSEKLVLLALADRHNADTGDCFPSLDKIADDTCTSRDTARRATQSLEQKGLLSRVLVTDLQGRTLGYRYNLHMGDSKVLPLGLQDATPEGGTVLPKPVKETRKEKPISRSLPLADFDSFWKGYPRKVGRLAAEKAYVKARRSSDHETIMAALGSYSFNVRRATEIIRRIFPARPCRVVLPRERARNHIRAASLHAIGERVRLGLHVVRREVVMPRDSGRTVRDHHAERAVRVRSVLHGCQRGLVPRRQFGCVFTSSLQVPSSS